MLRQRLRTRRCGAGGRFAAYARSGAIKASDQSQVSNIYSQSSSLRITFCLSLLRERYLLIGNLVKTLFPSFADVLAFSTYIISPLSSYSRCHSKINEPPMFFKLSSLGRISSRVG